MNKIAAVWPVARGSLARNRTRYLVMAALLGLAVAAYLLYATFMVGANVEAGLAMEPHDLPADIVYLGRRPLGPEVIDEWSRRGGVVQIAPLRQTRYVTELGSLRVFALPAGSPAWAAAAGPGGSVPKPGGREILLPEGFYERLASLAGADNITMMPQGAPASAAGAWRVAGTHAAADSVLGGSALVLLEEMGPSPNSMFIWTSGQAATNSLATLIEIDYLAPGRPVLYGPEDPTVVHTRSAEALAEGILAQTYMPGFGIMTMVFIFSGVGLFTVYSLAFLDRKRDLAILKTVGMENTGVVALFLVEQGVIAAAGLGLGLAVAAVATVQLSEYIPAAQGLTAGSVIKAVISGLAVQGAGVILPALTARVATVNQLLYGLPIPLYSRRVYQSEV